VYALLRSHNVQISHKFRSHVSCQCQQFILTLAIPQCNEWASGPNINKVFSSL